MKLLYPELRVCLAHSLMDVGAVLTRDSIHPLVVTRGDERGFKLKLHEKNPDAPLSPIYLNLRIPSNPKAGPLTPEIVEMAAQCMHSFAFMNEIHYNATAGIPHAGDPFAEIFSSIPFPSPLIKMGKEDAGEKRRIGAVVGEVPKGETVLVIDDLVTAADSKIEAIASLEAAGLVVLDVMVLVDREQGGKEQLAGNGYTLHSVFTISELLDLYAGSGTITPELASEIKAYLGVR
ncbi:MAG: hypothetical protein WCG73_00670 [Candidatus Moraniibacteriota bacterium]